MKHRIRHPSKAGVWAIIVAITLAGSNAAGQSTPRSPQREQRMDSPEYGKSTERVPEWERQRLLWRAGLKDSSQTERLDAQGTKGFDREFTERLAEFATAWNKLMQVEVKGGWNVKQARKTRRAFERLVRSRGWVENSRD